MSEEESGHYHRWAKDAGNKLKAYILAYSSAATAVFFLTLAGKDGLPLLQYQKWLLVAALIFYVLTVVLCLVELQIDAKRFYYVANQLERPENQRTWDKNVIYKWVRLRVIYASYLTCVLATVFSISFLISRIVIAVV